jgi:hypothetical protein
LEKDIRELLNIEEIGKARIKQAIMIESIAR